MADIIHRIGIKSSTNQIYDALSTIEGLSQWWTEEVQGDSQVGGKIEFSFRSLAGELKGKMVMEVHELMVGNIEFILRTFNGWYGMILKKVTQSMIL